MPFIDYSNQPPPTPAEQAKQQSIYTENVARMHREQAEQKAFDDKLMLIIAGAALLVVIFFGRWFLRFLREMVLNSAAKSVRAKRAMSGKVESLKREIVSRADANRKPLP
ncbi:hypothetical protein [Mesorhizobium sp.]|uniref:hypothetical protein n=1 Tax=Mesorhizobium sp. TaxID=1871066 RepID=UPI000FE48085|nr:hypothetical protein [Mesorhizobium sp.]RWK53498.1 MAG: hypothetical protein EOR48_22115 [Mesorhizobium sp.]RWL19725.1 MAG: hypothetical protein EOR57_14120 [Mesorhizobium sp.]